MLRWAALAALICSCVDDGDWCDLSGRWAGSWTSHASGSGALGTTLDVTGHDVAGMMTFSGSSCIDAAQLAGMLTDKTVAGSATAGATRVDITAHWVGLHLEGTYDMISAGPCTGDNGTFALQKQ